MTDNHTATASITLPHPPEKVWEALTRPEIVKQWMFGTDLDADWTVGGAVFYRGEWNGAPYEDRGTILEIDPPQRLKMNFYSAISGLPDEPEYWQPITYTLDMEGEGTHLAIVHENNASAEAAASSEGNWATVLEELRDTLGRVSSAR